MITRECFDAPVVAQDKRCQTVLYLINRFLPTHGREISTIHSELPPPPSLKDASLYNNGLFFSKERKKCPKMKTAQRQMRTTGPT